MHTPANQEFWDIVTWEFPLDGPADEEYEMFGIDSPLSATVPEEFVVDEDCF